MTIRFLESDFAVCKLRDLSRLNLASGFFFLSKTPDELSLVCFADEVPDNALSVDAGWRAFRVEGTLAFNLVGILSRLTGILAAKGISVFAVSTYDTDYVLVKEAMEEVTREALRESGYTVV